jgi:hypothetical protein
LRRTIRHVAEGYFMSPRTTFLLLGVIVTSPIFWGVIHCLQLFQA